MDCVTPLPNWREMIVVAKMAIPGTVQVHLPRHRAEAVATVTGTRLPSRPRLDQGVVAVLAAVLVMGMERVFFRTFKVWTETIGCSC